MTYRMGQCRDCHRPTPTAVALGQLVLCDDCDSPRKRRSLTNRACAACGEMFRPDKANGRQRTHCLACRPRREEAQEAPEDRTCRGCDDTFTALPGRGPKRRYCFTCRPVPMDLGVCVYCGDVFTYRAAPGVTYGGCPEGCLLPPLPRTIAPTGGAGESAGTARVTVAHLDPVSPR